MLWKLYSNRRFGLSIQKQILKNQGFQFGITQWNNDTEQEQAWKNYALTVGWYRKFSPNSRDIYKGIEEKGYQQVPAGVLPSAGGWSEGGIFRSIIFSRCDL